MAQPQLARVPLGWSGSGFNDPRSHSASKTLRRVECVFVKQMNHDLSAHRPVSLILIRIIPMESILSEKQKLKPAWAWLSSSRCQELQCSIAMQESSMAHLFLVFNIVLDVFNTSIVVILCCFLYTGEERSNFCLSFFMFFQTKFIYLLADSCKFLFVSLLC